jgi:adenine/guanine phosphoribosyltransferase-like PRPP-binding protein
MVNEIPTENLAQWHGIPHLKRAFFPPPGKNNPELSYQYQLYSARELPEAINKFKFHGEQPETSEARRTLLRGLLEYGGVGQFGEKHGESDLGLDYSHFLKHEYMDEIANPVYNALGEQITSDIRDKGYSRIDGVLAPEKSGIKHGETLSNVLGVEKIIVKKDTTPKNDRVEVALDGYTLNEVNVISLTKKTLGELKKDGKSNFLLVDDILDSGLMTMAIALLLQRARATKENFDVNLIGIVTPFEKVYTGAGKLIEDLLGPIPITSLIQIEDMGLLDEQQVQLHEGKEAWIKIVGMEKAIPCNLTDFRQ